jgi:flagellin
VHFRNFYVNSNNGTVYEGNIVLTLGNNFVAPPAGSTINWANFEAAYVGQIAKSDVALRDIDKFWDANGRFLLDDPKTITLFQGNGNRTSITLYATDTMEDVRGKLDDAIGQGLGQAQYFTGTNKPVFASFVSKEDAKKNPNSSMSVAGTFVIRTIMPGAAGRLNFSGDEDLIRALSLNVIQDARETRFTVSVDDAHKARNIASNVKIAGNVLYGVVHPNIDVEFSAMANIDVEFDGTKFNFTKQTNQYTTILHLADNTTVFQIGANEGEDMGINIGDMSSHALGVHTVLVTDRELAARSITIIDNAIQKVSSQRAKLGAYQNRLEHTIANLTTASMNLTASESRIRDADMAKEMVEFTKLNILSQAGTSMLAQANMMPQSILALLR